MHPKRSGQLSARHQRGYRMIAYAVILVAGIPWLANSQQGSQHIVVKVGDQSRFEPGTKQSINISANGVHATLESGNPYRVIYTRSNKTTTVSLPETLLYAETLHLFDSDRLVVTGMVSGDVSIVAIVDLDRGETIDSFWCYQPAISPDGHYIVFIKFFPPHGISSADDHYMLYNVSLTPTENRPDLKKWPKPWEIVGWDVGEPLYPPGIANLPGNNFNVGDRPVHILASDFFWNKASSEVIFLEEFKGVYTIVATNFLRDGFHVWTAAVPRSLICLSSEANASVMCSQRLEQVIFPIVPSDPIRLVFRGVSGTRNQPIGLELHAINTPQMFLSGEVKSLQ